MYYNIPLNFKEGVYGISSLNGCSGDMLELEFDEDYKILTYYIPGNIIPGYEWRSQINIYSIQGDELDGTLGCLDFHAKIGTKEQKDAVMAKYPDSPYVADNPGDYPSDMVYGDNETLKIMVLCADRDEMDFWKFATDIMEKRIEEKAVAKLDKAEDFEFLATEYD